MVTVAFGSNQVATSKLDNIIEFRALMELGGYGQVRGNRIVFSNVGHNMMQSTRETICFGDCMSAFYLGRENIIDELRRWNTFVGPGETVPLSTRTVTPLTWAAHCTSRIRAFFRTVP